MNLYIEAKAEKILEIIEFFKKEIARLRTGRLSPTILESVSVEAYGTQNPIQGVANITMSDNNLLIIPFDKNITKEIEKAIVNADLGLGVTNEGEQIRITMPQMTEENRKDIVKKLNERHEQTRIKLRQVRDDIKEAIEKGEKEKEITEDDKFRFLKELDEEINKNNDVLRELRDMKEKEIMTI